MVPVTPNRFRDTIQRQIQTTVNRTAGELRDFSIDGKDGRYLSSYPSSETIKLSDEFGNFYHVIGVSAINDLSVVAP